TIFRRKRHMPLPARSSMPMRWRADSQAEQCAGRPDRSWNIMAGQQDAFSPQRFGRLRIDRERADARATKLAIRYDGRNVTVLAIDSTNVAKLRRSGAPYRRRRAL